MKVGGSEKTILKRDIEWVDRYPFRSEISYCSLGTRLTDVTDHRRLAADMRTTAMRRGR